ncbi:MAG TPA: cobalt ECF transporter T component CbiQ [Chloroflexi bacterium]|nr:cobalt ECF transporter T component CbiQ [Chloroflexota bacterium]
MRQIDAYAYSNRISKLHPAYKVGASLLALVLCLTLNRPLASLLILALMLGLTIFWAGVSWRFVLTLLLTEGSFLLAGVLGVAISVSTMPDAGGAALGPFWVRSDAASVWLALNLFLRALGSVSAMNFLALTTPILDLIELLRRLRVPEVLVEVMGLTYRFIFILFDSLERMTLAQEVRLGFGNWRSSLRSAALIGTNLFIDAFRRSRILETALQSRAWDGALRVLPRKYNHPFQKCN